MSELPLVTVFTPIYNTGKFVVLALESVQKQTYKNFEHIIIDDASTDNSVLLVEEWIKKNSYNCLFIKHPKNKGLPETLNEVLAIAKGKYLAIIGDDLWETDKIEKQVGYLNNDDTIAMLCGNSKLIDEDNNYLGIFFPLDYALPENVYLSLLSLDRGVIICIPTAIYNIEILRREGGFRSEYMQEDYYVLLKLAKKYKIVFENNLLVSYRERHDSLGRNYKYLVRLKKDMLHLLMEIKPSNLEEEKGINTGIMNVLKPIYYYLNTSKLDKSDKSDLYLAALTAIKFLKDIKSHLTFSEKMLLFAIKNKIPYKYTYKAMKILDNKFKM